MPHNTMFFPRRRPGIFGVRPQDQVANEPAEKEEERRNFFDRFAEIFAGRSDPRLSAEQNERIRNNSLIEAGLAIMAAGGRQGLDRASVLTSLAEGAQAGRGAGRSGRQSQVLGEIAGQDPSVALPQFRQLFAEAISSGQVDAAKSIATIIQSMEAAASKAAGQNQFIYKPLGDDIIIIDPRTAEEVGRFKGESSATAKFQRDQVFDPALGKNVLAVFDPAVFGYRSIATGEVIPNAEPKQILKDGVDPYLGAFLEIVGPSFQNNLNIIEELGPPNIFEHLLDENQLLRFMAPEDAQRFNAAGDDTVSQLIFIRSGRQASDRERAMLRQALIPRPGDKPKAVAEKIARLRSQGRAFIGKTTLSELQSAMLPGIAGQVDAVLSPFGGPEDEDKSEIFREFRR